MPYWERFITRKNRIEDSMNHNENINTVNLKDKLKEKLPIIPEVSGVSPDKIIELLDSIIEYKELKMAYECAIKEIETKLNILNTEFQLKYERNPISSIQSRLKSNISIFNKLKQKNLEPTFENIENELSDIAGIRVICNYIDDIYKIANALIRQNDVEVIKVKDYIEHPKENGYRSLHIIIKIPVFFSQLTKKVKVEIQIRTIAMNFWASLEHQMRYKGGQIKDAQMISKELKKCSEVIFETDEKMQSIRRQIEQNPTEDHDKKLIMDKLKKIYN